jgi:4-amino-4-deoxy-L-arabinose transferase-like glycosyltransferase
MAGRSGTRCAFRGSAGAGHVIDKAGLVKSRPISLWLAICVILIAAALRFVALADLPPGLFFDESANGVDALRVLGGWFPVFFPADQGREPLFISLQAAALALIGPSPFALRLPAAFLGVATVAATFAAFRAIAGINVGLIGSGLLAASFWDVGLSRLAFRTDAMPLFTTLAAYFLWKAVRCGRLGLFLAGGVCLGIGLYTYIPARLAPVLFAAWLVGCVAIRPWRAKTSAREVGLGTIVMLGVCLVVALPLAYYFYHHPHDFIERIRNAVGPAPTRTPLEGFVRAVSGLFWIGDPNVRHDLPGWPLVEVPVALLGVIGLAAGRRWRDGSGALILLWCVAMLAPAALTDEPAHALRLAGELPFVHFFPAVGLGWIASRQLPGSRVIGPAIAGAFILGNTLVTARNYFISWPALPEVNHFFQADLLHALDLVDQVPAGAPVVATSLVVDGMAIPSAFVPKARARIHAVDGEVNFVLPIHGDRPVYYVYARSDEPPDFLDRLVGLTRLATSTDRFGQIDGELFRADSSLHLPAPSRIVAANIGPAVRVDGADLVTRVRPGDYVPYALHWTVRGNAPPAKWELFAHLVDRNGQRLIAQDYNRGFTPSEWRDGDQVISWLHLQIPAGTPPTVADVHFGVIDSDSGKALAVTTPAGVPAGNVVVVGPVRVAGPAVPPSPPPQHPLSVRFGSAMMLTGFEIDRPDASNSVVRLHWHAAVLLPDDYTVFVHLLDLSGRYVVGADSQPAGGQVPTSTWQPGETVVDEHRLTLPPGSNATALEIGVYLLSTGERLPAVDVTSGKSEGDAIRLPW